MGKENWGWRRDTDWFRKTSEEISKYKYQCPKCGRKMVIAYKMEKTICDYCGTLIYKDEKARFKDKITKMLRRKENE